MAIYNWTFFYIQIIHENKKAKILSASNQFLASIQDYLAAL